MNTTHKELLRRLNAEVAKLWRENPENHDSIVDLARVVKDTANAIVINAIAEKRRDNPQ